MSNESKDIVEHLLRDGQSVHFRAGGPSMNPAIKDGDLVKILPVHNALRIRPGNIILFRKYDRLLLHRVIKIKGPAIFTAGDASLEGLEKAAAGDIIGKAFSVTRHNKTSALNSFWRERAGLLRYYTRPVRRVIHHMLIRRHTVASVFW